MRTTMKSRDGEQEQLDTFYIDVKAGVMIVNGTEVNNVTAFSLNFKEGKYGLEIDYSDLFKAIVP